MREIRIPKQLLTQFNAATYAIFSQKCEIKKMNCKWIKIKEGNYGSTESTSTTNVRHAMQCINYLRTTVKCLHQFPKDGVGATSHRSHDHSDQSIILIYNYSIFTSLFREMRNEGHCDNEVIGERQIYGIEKKGGWEGGCAWPLVIDFHFTVWSVRSNQRQRLNLDSPKDFSLLGLFFSQIFVGVIDF